MPQKPGDVTLTVATLASVFGSLAAAVYAFAGTEPSPIVGLFLSFAPLFAIVLWLQGDAARTGVGAVHDLGYFLLLAWPFVIPWYAFKTRGRAGCWLFLGLFGLILAPTFTAALVGYLVWGVSRSPGCPRTDLAVYCAPTEPYSVFGIRYSVIGNRYSVLGSPVLGPGSLLLGLFPLVHHEVLFLGSDRRRCGARAVGDAESANGGGAAW